MVGKYSKLFLLLFVVLLSEISLAQSEWTGEYFYDEDGGETAGGTKIYVAHTIKVTEQDGNLTAHIYSQGFQTSRDIFADVDVRESEIKFRFRQKGPDDTLGSYAPGDLLLALVKRDKELLTFWHEFKPVLDENLETGLERFKIAKREQKLWTEVSTPDSRVVLQIPSNFERFRSNGILDVVQGSFKESLQVSGPTIFSGSVANTILRMEYYALPTDSDAKTLSKVYRNKTSRGKHGYKNRNLHGHDIKVFVQTTPDYFRESWFLVLNDRVFVFTAMSRNGRNKTVEHFFAGIRIDGQGDSPSDTKLDFATSDPVLPDSSLKIIQKTTPGYSTLARKKGITGSIAIRLTFGESGLVTNMQVLNTLPYGLDLQAKAAAAQLLYFPEVKNGKPSPVTKTVQYTFSIY